MNKILRKIQVLTLPMLALGVFSSLLISVSSPTPVFAACDTQFFGLPAWYDGLTDSITCDIVHPDKVGGLSSFIWRIALNVIEAIMMIVGYASVIMIIIGGYKYMIATGSPDNIKAAKDTIRNAIIGLVVALGSVGIINVVAGAL
jgi:hypothetical protein